MNIFKEANPFRGANNPFNKDYKPKPAKKKPSRKSRIERVEIINQRTGQHIGDVAPGAVYSLATMLSEDKESDNIDFIGIDRNGYVYDTWTLSDVLAGYFVI